MCGETCCCTISLTTHLDTHTLVDCTVCGGDIVVSKNGPKPTMCQMCATQVKTVNHQERKSPGKVRGRPKIKQSRVAVRTCISSTLKRLPEGKKYRQVGDMRRDVRSCDECGQSFLLLGELKKHAKSCRGVESVIRRGRPRGRPPSRRVRPHASGAMHRCQVCEKKFVQILHLRQHLVLHLKEGHISRSHPQLSKCF